MSEEKSRVIDFKDLIKAGLHFGHQTARWNPKMDRYIWGHRNGIHLIDVAKTATQLERAAQFLESVAAQGQQILFVGTKKPAQQAILLSAKAVNMPCVNERWVGGTLTNFPQVKKSVTKLLHLEDVLSRATSFNYTKKELSIFQKMAGRLQENVGGIRTLKWPIGALVLIDVKKELTALKEAIVAKVPVVALVDTNCDPSLVDYVIPGNDDSPKAVTFVLDYLSQAVQRGLAHVERKELQEEALAAEESLTERLAGELAQEEDRSGSSTRRAPRNTHRALRHAPSTRK
jgi:small subunit ribosomal protein S2